MGRDGDGEHQLTCTDIRDELKAFAEVVLKRHLDDLACRVRKDVRSDIEQIIKERGAARRVTFAGTESLSPLRSIGIARRDEERPVRCQPSITIPENSADLHAAEPAGLNEDAVRKPPPSPMDRGVSPLSLTLQSEAELQKADSRYESLREAVLGSHNETEVIRNVKSVSTAVGVEEEAQPPCARRLARNVWFERGSALLIFLNSIFIGVQTDYLARNELQDVPTECQVIEIVFLVAFVVELGIRFLAFRLDFFRLEDASRRPNQHFYWNILDCLVIGLQVIQVVTTPFSNSSVEDAMSKVSLLRLVRLVRLFRVVRLVKVLRFVADLRMIVYGIWRSLTLFFWAIVALTIMNFMCSVYFTDLVLTNKLSGTISAPDINKHFGSLGDTMVTLFMAVTGGRNWGDLTDILSDKMDFWVMGPFLLYMAFTLYAVLNVITGVFLETAMDSAREEKEFYVICNARLVFQAADIDGTGTITWPDLERTLEHRDVRRFFDAVDIEVSEARALFRLLDASGDGRVSADEFIDGCLRVRGPSKSLDLLVLQKEVSELFQRHIRVRKQDQVRTKMATAALKLPPPRTPSRATRAPCTPARATSTAVRSVVEEEPHPGFPSIGVPSDP